MEKLKLTSSEYTYPIQAMTDREINDRVTRLRLLLTDIDHPNKYSEILVVEKYRDSPLTNVPGYGRWCCPHRISHEGYRSTRLSNTTR
jgi:hypothetical protein